MCWDIFYSISEYHKEIVLYWENKKNMPLFKNKSSFLGIFFQYKIISEFYSYF